MFAREESFGAARAVPVVRVARVGGRFPPGMLLLPALAVALLLATGLRNARREADADPAAPRVGDDERRANLGGLLMSLNMLIETRDGFDYTGAQCKAWMREAGFRESYVEALTGPDATVVAIK